MLNKKPTYSHEPIYQPGKKKKKIPKKLLYLISAIVLVIIILVAVLINIKKPEDVHRGFSIEEVILQEVELNSLLREEVLSTNGVVWWEDIDFPPQTKEKIQSMTPYFIDCVAKICEISDSCFLTEEETEKLNLSSKKVYSESILISPDQAEKNKIFRIFCWGVVEEQVDDDEDIINDTDILEPFCGNGVINAGETCDGSAWGNITGCSNFDFAGGTLSCGIDCKFDTSLCTGSVPGVCGDGNINNGETCDGSAWGDITGCSDFDFVGGTLSCGTDCQFDTSLCTGSVPGVCGDGVIDAGETCDGSAWGDITGCSNFDFAGGTLSCGIGCQFDTSLCTGSVPGVCGDGNINNGETCDGSAWGDITGCSDFDFAGGTLSCGIDCKFDTSLCTGSVPGVCGDGNVDDGEECDGTNLGGKTCQYFGYKSGNLTCKNDCAFNFSGCIGCILEKDETFCSRYEKNCGVFSGIDNCGKTRTVDCGSCTAPETCGGGGLANVCGEEETPQNPIEFVVNPGFYHTDGSSWQDTDGGGIFIHDVDSDGLMDFVLTSEQANGVGWLQVYDHWGNKLWSKTGVKMFDYMDHPSAIAGDMDGDGKQEVAYLKPDHKIKIVDGVTGSQEKIIDPGQSPHATKTDPVGLAIANLRGVGDRDVVVQYKRVGEDSSDPVKAINLETGTTLWTYDKFMSTEHNMFRQADLDGDGRDELAGVILVDHDGSKMNSWKLEDFGVRLRGMDSLVIADIFPAGMAYPAPPPKGDCRDGETQINKDEVYTRCPNYYGYCTRCCHCDTFKVTADTVRIRTSGGARCDSQKICCKDKAATIFIGTQECSASGKCQMPPESTIVCKIVNAQRGSSKSCDVSAYRGKTLHSCVCNTDRSQDCTDPKLGQHCSAIAVCKGSTTAYASPNMLEVALAETYRRRNSHSIIVNEERVITMSAPAWSGDDPDKLAVGDFNTGRQGLEVFCRSSGGDGTCSRSEVDRYELCPWVHDAKGNVLNKYLLYDIPSRPSWWTTGGIDEVVRIDWDGDNTHEIVGKERFAGASTYMGAGIAILNPITGEFKKAVRTEAGRVYAADFLGDYREEIIVVEFSTSKVKIFWNDQPNTNSKPSYWDQQHYARQKQNWNYYSP